MFQCIKPKFKFKFKFKMVSMCCIWFYKKEDLDKLEEL